MVTRVSKKSLRTKKKIHQMQEQMWTERKDKKGKEKKEEKQQGTCDFVCILLTQLDSG